MVGLGLGIVRFVFKGTKVASSRVQPRWPMDRAKGDMAIKCEHCVLAEDWGVLFSSGSGPKDVT